MWNQAKKWEMCFCLLHLYLKPLISQASKANPMKRFLLFAILLLAFLSSTAQEQLAFHSTVPPQRPVVVQTGFNLLNITAIDEREETFSFEGFIVFQWKDERQAYDYDSASYAFNDYNNLPPKLYEGEFAVAELYDGWRPRPLFANGIGNRTTTSVSLRIWPDGTILYAESFSCTAETPMNLRMYPFDRQFLDVFIYPSTYKSSDVVFTINPSLVSTWPRTPGIAEWNRDDVTVDISEIDIIRADGKRIPHSELQVRATVSRQPMHTIIGILLPMFLLVCLSWSVFWIDTASLTDRINITFIGILSVVAYYLVIQENIPEISYFTLMDGFIVTSFILLALTVVVCIVVEKLEAAGRETLATRINHSCRWVFPFTYVLVLVLLSLFFFI